MELTGIHIFGMIHLAFNLRTSLTLSIGLKTINITMGKLGSFLVGTLAYQLLSVCFTFSVRGKNARDQKGARI